MTEKTAEPSEPVDPDDEPTKPTYSTGGIVSGSGITTAKISAGTITSGTISPTYWSSSGGYVTRKGPKMKVKDLPTKRPKKILIAFLDEDDNQEWAAKLKAKEISIDLGLDGVPKMNLEVDLMVEDDE